MQELLDRALPVLDFLLACAGRRFDIRDTDQKVQAAGFVLAAIAKIPDAMLRAEYARLLAARLKLDESAVLDELNKSRRAGVETKRPATSLRPAAAPPARGAERMLLALVLDQPARWPAIRGQVTPEQIEDSRLRRLLQAIAELPDEELAHTSAAGLMARLAAGDPDGQVDTDRLISELVQLAQSITSREQGLDEAIRRMRADDRQRRLAELRQAIHRAQELGQEQELGRLLSGYQQLARGVPAGTEG